MWNKFVNRFLKHLKKALTDSVNGIEIPENQNANKITDNVLKIKKIPSQRKCLGVTNHIKILNPKQMLQRLSITQVKAGNTSINSENSKISYFHKLLLILSG